MLESPPNSWQHDDLLSWCAELATIFAWKPRFLGASRPLNHGSWIRRHYRPSAQHVHDPV